MQAWLERTPGLEGDFNFPVRYKATIDKIMAESLGKIEAEENEAMKTHLMTSYKNKKQQFDSIFDKSVHDALVKRGERRFSHKALQGALMISMYSEEPRFHQPHTLLMALMDIDSLITKWRCELFLMSLLEFYILKFLCLPRLRQPRDAGAEDVGELAAGDRRLLRLPVPPLHALREVPNTRHPGLPPLLHQVQGLHRPVQPLHLPGAAKPCASPHSSGITVCSSRLELTSPQMKSTLRTHMSMVDPKEGKGATAGSGTQNGLKEENGH